MNRKLIRILPLFITASLATVSGAYAADVIAKVGKTPMGKVIVNGKGMSAYFFDLDKAHSGVSACAGLCAANWPAITSSTAKPHVVGISGAVGTIAIKGGGKQVTINGRPIYTFVFDTAPGEAKGQGAQGLWYVISPTGKEIKALKLAIKSTPQPIQTSTYRKSNY